MPNEPNNPWALPPQAEPLDYAALVRRINQLQAANNRVQPEPAPAAQPPLAWPEPEMVGNWQPFPQLEPADPVFDDPEDDPIQEPEQQEAEPPPTELDKKITAIDVQLAAFRNGKMHRHHGGGLPNKQTIANEWLGAVEEKELYAEWFLKGYQHELKRELQPETKKKVIMPSAWKRAHEALGIKKFKVEALD